MPFTSKPDKIGIAALPHNLHPAHVFACSPVVNDVGPIHTSRGMEGGSLVFRLRRDNQAAVLPVVEIGGAVAPHPPVPDAVFTVGLFFILAIPIVQAILIKDGAAVGLNAAPTGIQPGPAGIKSVIHGHSPCSAAK